MSQNPDYSECPVCGQGELLVVQEMESQKYLIMCDDCESTWSDPASSQDYNKCLDRNNVRVRDATQEEISNLGWTQFLVD